MLEKKMNLLIVQGGDFHPFVPCAEILQELLEQSIGAACEIVARDTAFDRELSPYDCIAMYTQGGHLTPQQEENLCAYVNQGGGLAGIHGANASFKKNTAYPHLIGSHFVRHDPGTHEFLVSPTPNTRHELAEDLAPFAITDEFYEIAWDGGEQDVFLEGSYKGVQKPMAYTKKVGQGRVFYTANGHDEKAFRNPAFQTLTVRGVLWAAGGGGQAQRFFNG
jgi:type 1 glutamine amidotransferase